LLEAAARKQEANHDAVQKRARELRRANLSAVDF
jgi:hypothetical protein